ncbi:MAG: UPF0262 family protein [Sphingomonadaceae bacterium]
MGEHRIIAVDLDERSILRRREDIERERRVAIFDLLEDNHFKPLGHKGPFRVLLRVEEDRLAIDLRDEEGAELDTIRVPLQSFRTAIRDYFTICESYFKALGSASPHAIEPIDMARRALHNEAAEQLVEELEGKIDLDHATARRLFTLICVLHVR